MTFTRLWRTGALLPAAFVLMLSACEGGTEPEVREPGVRMVSGGVADDTVQASVGDLVLEVRGADGAPAAGMRVELRSAYFPGPHVGLSRPGSPEVDASGALLTTDSRGRASTRVRLGTVAGEAQVTVSVPELGYQATATYTVRPGAVADARVEPADTAVYAGAQYTVRATATDRFGNARPGTLTYQPTVPAVAAVQGTSVSAAAIGRGAVIVRAGTAADTAWVSVVPQGTLAARRVGPDGPWTVWLMNLDGSGMQSLARGTAPGWGEKAQSLQWTPSGAELVFFGEGGSHQLWAATPAGAVRPLVATQGDLLQRQPVLSRDGSWIYYQAGDAGRYSTSIWRVRPDGAGRERLTPVPDFYTNDLDASPSPTGDRMVYGTDRERGWGISPPHRLVVMDLRTLAVQPLGVLGNAPRWSPGSEWIAYERDGRIWVVRSNGTDERPLTPAGAGYERNVSWSPDGQWIAAARNGPFIDLIRVSDGLVLPLAFSGWFIDPTWRP